MKISVYMQALGNDGLPAYPEEICMTQVSDKVFLSKEDEFFAEDGILAFGPSTRPRQFRVYIAP